MILKKNQMSQTFDCFIKAIQTIFLAKNFHSQGWPKWLYCTLDLVSIEKKGPDQKMDSAQD